MAAIVNDRDVLLQAASVRKLTTAGVAVVPTPSSYNFYLRADGSHGPDYVRISVATILCDGPFTFAVQGATKLTNITATTADIAFADLTSALAIVTVTAANAGAPVQGSCVVGVVSDGQSGQPGQPGQNGVRGAGMYYPKGNAWSDSVAAAACPGGVPVVGDVVCISNGTTYTLTKKYDGATWAPLGGVYDGSLFVTGSIQASAVDTRGIVVRDLQGNPIVGIGQPLQAAYFGGTVGGDNLCPNSSFEITSTSNMADGWGIYNNNASGEPAVSSIEAGRTGGKSLAITWSNSHTSQKGILRSSAVPQWLPNTTYIVSFYAKTTNLSSVSGMALQWNTNPTSTVVLANPNLSTSWQRYAFKIVWGSSAEVNGALFISVATGAGAGNVYFDDVMVAEGDVLTAYCPSVTEVVNTANAAAAAITAMSSDNVLSKGEKPAALQAWGVIYNERSLLQTQAGNLGVDSSAYRAKYDALESYLVSLGAGFTDNTVDTTIVGTTFNTRFSDYYLAKATLQNAMDAAAATTSTWAGTTGLGKPADNATVGAPAGTSVGGTEAGLLASRALNGDSAYNALPGINSAIASKLSAGSRNVLSGGGGLAVGSITWDGAGNYTEGYGVAMTSRGIVAYNTSGENTLYLSGSDGSAAFKGVVYAQAGTIGGMTLSGGALCTGGYTGWGWPGKDANGNWLMGGYFGPTGILLGNQNANKWFQVTYDGYISAPGLVLADGQLTLTQPILVNPKTTTSFSASIATVRITNQTPNVRVTTGIGVSLSGGSGASGYSYQWVFNSDTGGGSNAINATGLLSNPSLSITAQCSAGWYYASASVTVTDIATGATARASVRISIQFGSGAEV